LRCTALPTVRAAIDNPNRARVPSLGRTVALSSSFPKRRPWAYAALNSDGRRSLCTRRKRAPGPAVPSVALPAVINP
jgi:hypothetical protein